MFHWFRKRQKTTIVSPKVGIFNLIGEAADQMESEDEEFLSLFSYVFYNHGSSPCDLLILYCKIRDDGTIENSERSFREIIRETGAKVVLVASENSSVGYQAAAQNVGFGWANFVMTHQRKGQNFPKFFRQLFTKMLNGTTMPIAWNEIAPQIPNFVHEDCPDTVFICEAGQITFG